MDRERKLIESEQAPLKSQSTPNQTPAISLNKHIESNKTNFISSSYVMKFCVLWNSGIFSKQMSASFTSTFPDFSVPSPYYVTADMNTSFE